MGTKPRPGSAGLISAVDAIAERIEMGAVAEDPDRELVERFRRGETAAFDEIVTRHRAVVYSIARRLLRSHDEADEAAQQTFVRAWRSLARFRGEAALRTWLCRIAINVAKTLGTRARPETSLDPEDRPDPAGDSEEALGRSEARARVRRAVAKLPPRQREVVLLKVFSDMTYREVADVLTLSDGAVKAHLHQAVANLRRILS